ncbi:MAG: dephospho-CoA kinase [Eubacteriales bacterium]|nr:dephospho-CoA kinase [Eubacteriales bacterium]
MKVIGITGGVGAGKSTVLRYIREQFKARVLQLDEAGHKVIEPGEDCYCEILEQFGEEVLLPEGRIDRQALGEIVFRNQKKLEILNSLVHPAVKKYVTKAISQAEQDRCPLLILESAILFDTDYDAICDEVWYIYADEPVRIERIRKERGYSEERIRGILANQATEEFFRSRCSYTVENNGDWEETCRQIDERIKQL